ncbi:hypothetical protein NUW58_g3792 [Xylaria curta]|uniref:Uncharacterized protein n=1 Tax=Xylaria curta TaxID=42375 RepID=A0ACC1P9B3_9PEZI|nr:hypothetical protein NUW58_g3792 [Xylaria curta]
MGDGNTDGDASGSSAVARKKTAITYEKYIAMVNLIVSRVNDDEASGAGEGVDGEDLVQWYLEQKEEDLDNEEDYHREMDIAKMVLKKMVKDNILMAVRGEGLAEEDAEGAQSTAGPSQKVVYVLHPNCAVEEY